MRCCPLPEFALILLKNKGHRVKSGEVLQMTTAQSVLSLAVVRCRVKSLQDLTLDVAETLKVIPD